MSRHDYICTHNDKEIKGFFNEYRWLSNFYPCSIYIPEENRIYPSVENVYQAAKVKDEYREVFLDIAPNKSKNEWKKYPLKYKQEEWDLIKLKIMEDLLSVKFTTNEKLAKMLLDTGDKYLEETNYWKDIFWGVCNGVGENHLGKLLMKCRKFLGSF